MVDPGGAGCGRRLALSGIGNPFDAPPRDLLIVIVTLFVTFVMQFFDATRIVPELLHLTSLVWHAGFVWQLVTYPYAGYGGASVWFLVSLLMLHWFGRDLFYRLRQKRFLRLVVS